MQAPMTMGGLMITKYINNQTGPGGQWRVMDASEQNEFWEHHCTATKGGTCDYEHGKCKRCGKQEQK